MVWALRLAVLCIALSFSVGEAAAGTCSAAVHANRVAAASAYAKRMAADRKAFSKTHKTVAQRRAFVTAQQRKLKALRAAAACTVPPPPPPVDPVGPAYTFDPSVSPDDTTLVRDGIALGLAYAARIGVPGDFAFKVVADNGNGTILARDATLTIHTTNEAWLRLPPGRRTEIVVHELFHVIQYVLGHKANAAPDDQVPPAGARWLLEGSAEVFGYRAVADAGQLDYGQERARFLAGARASKSPLASLETWGGMLAAAPYHYAVAFTAIDYAVGPSGDVARLASVWREVGKGKTWGEAFAAVFGRTIDAFYAEFASYRTTL